MDTQKGNDLSLKQKRVIEKSVKLVLKIHNEIELQMKEARGEKFVKDNQALIGAMTLDLAKKKSINSDDKEEPNHDPDRDTTDLDKYIRGTVK